MIVLAMTRWIRRKKWRKITLLCLSKARASTPNLSGNMKQKRPGKKNRRLREETTSEECLDVTIDTMPIIILNDVRRPNNESKRTIHCYSIVRYRYTLIACNSLPLYWDHEFFPEGNRTSRRNLWRERHFCRRSREPSC